MTEPDHFILRWARLKRGSDTRNEADVSRDGSSHGPVETVLPGADSTVARPRIDAAAEEPFDPASLPSIEAITASTDVRGFLQSRVPAELTRAALRRAWASDPAIRDFIGIAENQWDFNDPNAIPGFGPLRATDDVPALLARALGGRDKLAELVPELPISAEASLPPVTEHEPTDLDRSVRQSSDGSPSTNNIRGIPDDSSGEGAASKNDCVTEQVDAPRRHRSHGSAVPR
ncbi:MAG TPA: DUF3306 domain-containing protein [Bradyrhizobium sp.]|jgi:hypothetical protein|nr:DUF3306 domain-containing protein [Bradyrhizobium sp.]